MMREPFIEVAYECMDRMSKYKIEFLDDVGDALWSTDVGVTKDPYTRDVYLHFRSAHIYNHIFESEDQWRDFERAMIVEQNTDIHKVLHDLEMLH